jgi:peptide/nickel transport system permease protein
VVAALIAVALLAPVIAPHDPESISTDRILAAPTLEHPFGLDSLGRDVLTRVIYAFRVSLLVALGSVTVAFAIGAPIGLVAGYRGRLGGWPVDAADRPAARPARPPARGLLIAIVGPGATIALLAIAIIYLPIIARVVRSSVIVVREQSYVDGRARGASEVSIVLRHVLPNSLGPALVQATVLIGFAIQIEAALPFLGLGAQPRRRRSGSCSATAATS